MPENKYLLKVFLSYASQDRLIVQELSKRLASEGWIDTWVDEKKLLPGQDWRTKIEEAVETSDIVIICLSNNSVTKEGFVQKELRYAREISFEKPDETIFLVPLRLDDCTVPRGLRFYQWADYFGENREDTYHALTESLKIRYEQKQNILEKEYARIEKEKQDREAAEKIELEHVEKERQEKEIAEKEKRELAEKIERERLEKQNAEFAEKVAREKTKQLAVEKTAREKARKEKEKAEKIEFTKKSDNLPKKQRIAKVQPEILKKLPAKKKVDTKIPQVETRVSQNTFWIIGVSFVIFGIIFLSSLNNPTFTPQPTTENTRTKVVFTSNYTETGRPSEISTPTLLSSPTSTLTSTPANTLTPMLTSTPLPNQIIDPKGVTMRLVPAGEFTMGSESVGSYAYAQPVHEVYLDDFYMDIYEVTNSMYQTCVEAKVCTPPKETKSYTRNNYYSNSQYYFYPVVYVDWSQANAYCKWREGSLPTEAQWEKAARGIDARTYPWGEDISCDKANYAEFCVGDTSKVGNYEAGKSPYGIYDLAGNVEEWVNDSWSRTYYQISPYNNPLGPIGYYKVLRGGSWSSDNTAVHSAFRRYDPYIDYSDYPLSDIGFRCVKDVTP